MAKQKYGARIGALVWQLNELHIEEHVTDTEMEEIIRTMERIRETAVERMQTKIVKNPEANVRRKLQNMTRQEILAQEIMPHTDMVRLQNCLADADIKTYREAIDRYANLRSMSQKTWRELRAILATVGLRTGMTEHELAQWIAEDPSVS